MDKLLTIVGATATGKSALAVNLALEFNGEVVSADSRQIYRGLDTGTGKITPEETKGVPHHCLDIADPREQMSVAEYKEHARHAISDIQERGKLPILVGGTGFYVNAVVDDWQLPDVPPNPELRAELDQYDNERLYEELRQQDPDRAADIDPHNRVRLIRALEIIHQLGYVPRLRSQKSPYNLSMIGLALPTEELRDRIHRRLEKRIESGMIEEARHLHAAGLSWERMEQLGLEYRFLARHLQGRLGRDEMREQLETEIWHYAKRQLTWFRRDTRINWFRPDETNPIRGLVRSFV